MEGFIRQIFSLGSVKTKNIIIKFLEFIKVVKYGTHQLQLKWDMCGTCRGHVSCTCMFLSYIRNYTHYQLPSCSGLYESSSPFCT